MPLEGEDKARRRWDLRPDIGGTDHVHITAIRQPRKENRAQDSHESVRRARTFEADGDDFGAISDEPGAGGTEGRPFAFRVAIRR